MILLLWLFIDSLIYLLATIDHCLPFHCWLATCLPLVLSASCLLYDILVTTNLAFKLILLEVKGDADNIHSLFVSLVIFDRLGSALNGIFLKDKLLAPKHWLRMYKYQPVISDLGSYEDSQVRLSPPGAKEKGRQGRQLTSLVSNCECCQTVIGHEI